jgi:putative ABC transport system permease protein
LVRPAPHDLTVDDSEALVRRVPQIRRVAPLALGTSPASYGDRTRQVAVLGTTNDMLGVRKINVGVGRYLPVGESEASVAVLGAKVRRELFGGESPLGESVRIGERSFRVIGVMAPRGHSIGMDLDEVIHVPVEAGLALFNRAGLFRILAEVNSSEAIDAAQDRVIEVLTERHDGEEDVTVLTQDAVLSTFNKILGVLTTALAAIAAISLSVAGIGIMNVMLVTVSERTREIGLLKAVGVTPRQILAVFLTEAALISTAGGVVGLLVGVGAGLLFRHFQPDFPVEAPVWAVIAALLVSVSVGVVFGGAPARRAARLDPIEALMRKRT